MNAGATTNSQGPSVSMGAQPGFKVEVFYPFVVSFLLAGGNSSIGTTETNATQPAGYVQPTPAPQETDQHEQSTEYPIPVPSNIEEDKHDYNAIEEDDEGEEEEEEENSDPVREDPSENKPNSFFPQIPRPSLNGTIFENWGNADNRPPPPNSFFPNLTSVTGTWKPPSFGNAGFGHSVSNPNGRLSGNIGPLLATFFSGMRNSCYQLRFPATIETQDPKQIIDLFNSLTEQKREMLASYVENQAEH